MTIHVTQTQKLVTEAALSAVGASEMLRDPAIIDTLVRAMLVIQAGGMQAYLFKGFKRSCMSRNRRQPEQVTREVEVLEASVHWFHEVIGQARGEAARRIRGNRARRIKQLEQDAENWQREAARQREHLLRLCNGRFNQDAVNWNEVPQPQRWGGDDFDAA
jgi:hypothetical protein